MKNWLQIMLYGCLAGLLLACDHGAGLDQRKLDFLTFKTEVHPVLLRDCGFYACHGSSNRFFRVWGIGRVRLNPMNRPFDYSGAQPASTQEELDYTKQLAESMIDFNNPSRSLLLRKPLATEAGGSDHFGSDKFGRNVYRSVNDEGYVTLTRWVVSMSRPASGH
jgi:hypothetical protein